MAKATAISMKWILVKMGYIKEYKKKFNLVWVTWKHNKLVQ